MEASKPNSLLKGVIDELADESSYGKLFHSCRDEEALPSGENLKRVVDLCRAILFPGYYGAAHINRQTIRFHTGVLVETLHRLLTKEIGAGLCFANTDCQDCRETLFFKL